MSNIRDQLYGEKILILNERICGLTSRLYYHKQQLGGTSRPLYLPNSNQKIYEPLHKCLLKKFPNVDSKISSQKDILESIRSSILDELNDPYFTLVDILDANVHFMELVGSLSSAQLQMDICVNFDLTRNYFDLITNYFILLTLLSRFKDRIIVVALYNQAVIMRNSIQEDSYPRLSQFLTDFTKPVKFIHDQMHPYSGLMRNALQSLEKIFVSRMDGPQDWKQTQPFSLLSDQKMSQAPMHDTLPSELICSNCMERWIIFGYLINYDDLTNNEIANKLWKKVLINTLVISLYREEVIFVHSFIQNQLENIKIVSKRVGEVKEFQSAAGAYAPGIHRERRRYLRFALREVYYVFMDQPGLIGPRINTLLSVLTYATDEVYWLAIHSMNLPNKKVNVKMENKDVFVDQSIAELLFYIEELRDLTIKYTVVLRTYYAQSMESYHAPFIKDVLEKSSLEKEEKSLLFSVCETLTSLGEFEDSFEDDSFLETFNLSAVRLDIFRCEIAMSTAKYPVSFNALKPLFIEMNFLILHTKLIDQISNVLSDTSDLSFFFQYRQLLLDYFANLRSIPNQHRYLSVLPKVCTHFSTCLNEMCPEEQEQIIEQSFELCHKLCSDIVSEFMRAFRMLIPILAKYAYELLPKESVYWLIKNRLQRKRSKGNVEYGTVSKQAKNFVENKELPGNESARRLRENMHAEDQLHVVIAELSKTLKNCEEIKIFNRGVRPLEILLVNLNRYLMDFFREIVIYNPETKQISRPTEILNCLRAVLLLMINIENYLPIDITKIIKDCLEEHSQIRDSIIGKPTMNKIIIQWYNDTLIPLICSEEVIYSPHLQSFVLADSTVSNTSTHIDPFIQNQKEILEFSDLVELKALAEILTPNGVVILMDELVKSLANLWSELRRYVMANRTILDDILEANNKGDTAKSREKVNQIQNQQDMLHRMRIIGSILTFKETIKKAYQEVLQVHIPYLMDSGREVFDLLNRSNTFDQLLPPELQSKRLSVEDQLLGATLCDKMGFPTSGLHVDASLLHAIQGDGENDYVLGSLLPVCLAALFPYLARHDGYYYNAKLGGHQKNIHCIIPAVLNLVTTLISSSNSAHELPARWNSFLTLATASILPFEVEASSQIRQSGRAEIPLRNRQAVYILLDMVIQACPFLDYSQLEICLPYSLIRSAYHGSLIASKQAKIRS